MKILTEKGGQQGLRAAGLDLMGNLLAQRIRPGTRLSGKGKNDRHHSQCGAQHYCTPEFQMLFGHEFPHLPRWISVSEYYQLCHVDSSRI